jgi:hypothetical protein
MDVAVDAKRNSTALGTGNGSLVDIDLSFGDLIVINCNPEDTWRLARGAEDPLSINANGFNDRSITTQSEQVFRSGAMVGSFDNGNSFFPVGTLVQIKVLEGEPASLTLWCADSDNQNNQGTITAQVTTYSQKSI